MTTKELTRRMTHWVKLHNFCGDVTTRRTNDGYVVEFFANTTKTRASTMVTRLGLIAAEVVGGSNYLVDKELASDPPSDRASLATWRIYVKILSVRSLAAA